MKAELIKLEILVEKDAREIDRPGWFDFIHSIRKIPGYLCHAFVLPTETVDAIDCRNMEVDFKDWLPVELRNES